MADVVQWFRGQPEDVQRAVLKDLKAEVGEETYTSPAAEITLQQAKEVIRAHEEEEKKGYRRHFTPGNDVEVNWVTQEGVEGPRVTGEVLSVTRERITIVPRGFVPTPRSRQSDSEA